MIYADPQQIMAPLYGNFSDLRTFIDDSSLPPLPIGLQDFDEMNLIGSGYMIDREKLLAIPYDAPTMVLVYRADIFENPTYKDLYQAEKGYDWTPGPNITWEQYRDIAEWINTKVADGTIAEQVAGTGHQAKQYDSLMCDFSNVLLASGGGYFANPDYATWGTATPGGCDPRYARGTEGGIALQEHSRPGCPRQLELGLEWIGGSVLGRRHRNGPRVA